MSSNETYQMIDDTLTNRRVGRGSRRSAPARFRELLVAYLVMSLADLRAEGASERAQPTARPPISLT